MLPVLVLVGCPNVGKSTLFNRLTGTRDALVADYPGLTRDRLYGFVRSEAGAAIVVDTGGLTGEQAELDKRMSQQVETAVGEATVVILLVDGDVGCTAGDEHIAATLRKTGKPILLVVNKTEGRIGAELAGDFYRLGIGEPIAISAVRGDRINTMIEQAFALCPEQAAQPPAVAGDEGTRIAVLGRPNVGKSTLINRCIGEDRLVTFDESGTTRDSIAVPFTFDDEPFVLVDTAGIRRRAKVHETIEKFSVVKALQALEEADAVIVLIDAQEGLTEQDISLIGLILERGRALTIGVNKWDGLSERHRTELHESLDRQLPFLDFVEIFFISALHGSNIVDVLRGASRAAEAAVRDLPTNELNSILQAAIEAHPPPIVRRHRVKLSYAHQGGKRPPVIVIHGNQTKRLAGSYQRYLVNRFRKVFRLKGTPIRLELRTGKNPYEGRRNRLTPRQQRRRERIRKRK
ncbi:MAG: ribosome biogenesis GTPase Der [Gammaproteobacteria bacterium]|nr:ribosome biogenesis GTPase Der [Chromatiales bacterium]MDP6674374.1 ribosome biogenesis GTPase Der [Gammaproteobacteria bacterium]